MPTCPSPPGQVYAYDGMHRLTGYSQGTLNTTSYTLSSINASASWSLDSQGNRYDNSGTTYGTSYDAADESQSSGTAYSPGSGNTTTVTFGGSRSVIVTYDAWGRVVGTYYSPYAVGGSNGSAIYTTYSYDALGRAITTKNDFVGSADGTQTYYDGTNPIEERELDNATPLLTNVWSTNDGPLIFATPWRPNSATIPA